MTRFIFILILGFAIVSTSYAGEFTAKGITLGLNFAESSGRFVSDLSYKKGICAGGFVVYSFSDMYSIQTELLYSVKGYKIDKQDFKVNATFKYLEFPLLLKYMALKNEAFKTNLLIGPSLGYSLDATFTSKFTSFSDFGEIQNFRDFDFGAIIGLNVSIPTNIGDIILDIRYNLGLLSWDEKRDEFKNRAITTMVGYSL